MLTSRFQNGSPPLPHGRSTATRTFSPATKLATEIGDHTMKTTTVAVIWTATATAIALSATAHADSSPFQSPSGNLVCSLVITDRGRLAPQSSAGCDIDDYTYVPPPGPPCPAGFQWGHEVWLDAGSPAHFRCQGAPLATGSLPTLDYGQKKSAGQITCDSEPSGITCNDGSGHFFHLSRESYELG